MSGSRANAGGSFADLLTRVLPDPKTTFPCSQAKVSLFWRVGNLAVTQGETGPGKVKRKPESVEFPVFSRLSVNLATETSSQHTASSTTRSRQTHIFWSPG